MYIYISNTNRFAIEEAKQRSILGLQLKWPDVIRLYPHPVAKIIKTSKFLLLSARIFATFKAHPLHLRHFMKCIRQLLFKNIVSSTPLFIPCRCHLLSALQWTLFFIISTFIVYSNCTFCFSQSFPSEKRNGFLKTFLIASFSYLLTCRTSLYHLIIQTLC